MEGVADMVVHPGFGMPAAVKKMVPVGVNEPPTEARGAGVWWKKGNAMGPAEGQDKAEVREPILMDLAAGAEECRRDGGREEGREERADVSGACGEKCRGHGGVVGMHDLFMDAVNSGSFQELGNGVGGECRSRGLVNNRHNSR